MEKALQAAQSAREAEVPRWLRMNCLISWESKGTPPQEIRPAIKGLTVLNKALLRPYFLGGVALRG